MPNYHSAFDGGEYVRIADAETLRKFQQSWKFHNPLQEEQLAYASKGVTIVTVSFYHGGTPLYELLSVPGKWHEQCLVDGTIGEKAPSGVLAADYYSIAAETHQGLSVIVVRDPEKRELLMAFRRNAEASADAMRAVARVRSRRMFEWKYGFDGIYQEQSAGSV